MTETWQVGEIPEDLAARIRQRAARYGRSPEQEVLALLRKALGPRELVTPQHLLAEARAAGIETPAESVWMVREDRDAR